MGKGASSLYGSFFGIYISDDAKDPQHYAAILTQSGLGLPDRDYYLTDQFKDKKAKYLEYLTATLKRIDWPQPALRAQQILAMET
jgi:putative endopeptidase